MHVVPRSQNISVRHYESNARQDLPRTLWSKDTDNFLDQPFLSALLLVFKVVQTLVRPLEIS